MKTNLIALIALAVVLLLPTALYAQGTDSEAAIMAWVMAWHDALNAGDVDAALSFLADDAQIAIGDDGVFPGSNHLLYRRHQISHPV